MSAIENGIPSEHGWVKLYHPKGALVTLPVTASPLDYGKFLVNVSAMLEAGWLVQAPGLEEGEHKDDIGWLVKSFIGEEGVPAIDLYPANEHTKYALIRVYLNRAEDVAAFEFASKLKLASLPEYVGVGRLERGKSAQTDKLIVRAPKPFQVVWKENPKYNPDETDATKKKPKRLFVRWVDQPPVALPEPKPAEPCINREEAKALHEAAKSAGLTDADVLGHFAVERYSALPSSTYQTAMAWISQYVKAPAKPDGPLVTNFQAAALQTTLEKMGPDLLSLFLETYKLKSCAELPAAWLADANDWIAAHPANRQEEPQAF